MWQETRFEGPNYTQRSTSKGNIPKRVVTTAGHLVVNRHYHTSLRPTLTRILATSNAIATATEFPTRLTLLADAAVVGLIIVCQFIDPIEPDGSCSQNESKWPIQIFPWQRRYATGNLLKLRAVKLNVV